ncbi:DUF2742 domain-containing protein [Mycolicibacterium mucogenicum]|uniref:DUF2742 domain-containing protein n=1 Tax=Mycolicibacterium mucogenicum TaxID=56689 RepID=UPI00226A57D5|nr:DUF2742 domain-containing protein [Mycolicibacterium mucogenicum]MCX8556039.1 DUF2742 domain-containing protein [Mycolicibacterium mucogenicum]
MTMQPQEARPTGAGSPASQQVSWFEVYSFASRIAASHGTELHHLPLPGTPPWCGLPDDDARKLLALVLGGVREALQHEIKQEHLADAGKKIAAAVDAQAIARLIDRGPAYIERKKSA